MASFRYRCTDCGRTFARDEVRYLCPVCGPAYRPGVPLLGVLEAIFDYEGIRRRLRSPAPGLEPVLRGGAGVPPVPAGGQHPPGPGRAPGRGPGPGPPLDQERRPEPQRQPQGPGLLPGGRRGPPPGHRPDRGRLHRQRRLRPGGGVRLHRPAGADLRAGEGAQGQAGADGALRGQGGAGQGHLRRRLPAVPGLHRPARRPEPQHRLPSPHPRGQEDRGAWRSGPSWASRSRTRWWCRWATG